MNESLGQRPPMPENLGNIPALPPGFLPRIPESPDVRNRRQYEEQQAARRRSYLSRRPVRVVTVEDMNEMAFATPTPEGMTEQDFRNLPEGQRQRIALEHFYPGYDLRHIERTGGSEGRPDQWIVEIPANEVDHPDVPNFPPEQ